MSRRLINRIKKLEPSISDDKDEEMSSEDNLKFEASFLHEKMEFLEIDQDLPMEEDDNVTEEGNNEKRVNRSKKKRNRKKPKPKMKEEPQPPSEVEVTDIYEEENRKFVVLESLFNMEIDPIKLNYIFEDYRLNGYHVDLASKKRKLAKHYIAPKREEWLLLSNLGITMELVPSNDGLIHAKFVHSPRYKHITVEFYRYLVHHNDTALMALSQSYPTHIESLLRFSALVRHDDQNAAAGCIELIIHLHEQEKCPNFNFYSSNCRLSYKIYENRLFLISVFLHILRVEEKCCYESCFEICKMLLNLDSSDPLGILMVIDFYCLKAKEYEWLIKFYNSSRNEYKLNYLPNFQFSMGLSYFFMNETENCLNSLTTAIIKFPCILYHIERICSLKIDQTIVNHKIFKDSHTKLPPVLNTLVGIYVDKIKFLLRNVKIMNCFVEAAREAILQSSTESFTHNDAINRHVYKSYNNSVLRYVYLTGYADEFVSKESEKRDSLMHAIDPYPPNIEGTYPYKLISELNRTPT